MKLTYYHFMLFRSLNQGKFNSLVQISEHARERVILNQLPKASPSLAGTVVYAHFPISSPEINKKGKKKIKNRLNSLFL